MNQGAGHDSLLNRIDACCDRFEAAWKQGPAPEIAAFLAGWDEPAARGKLFASLLELDRDYRQRRGSLLSAVEYARRFPDFEAEIEKQCGSFAPGEQRTSPTPPAAVRLRAEAPHDSDSPTAASPSDPSGPGNGRYELQGEIARGGMGAVHKGRDNNLGRDLAIKVLLAEHRDNADVVRRFVEEAQIGGQLQHPGIVPVYELGQFADQRPYFSMKLVKGQTLTALLSARRDPADERPRFLGIFKQICETLAYAHSRGVIHRDLKPSNIMVGAFGEVQVMDWGLAKVLAEVRPKQKTPDPAQSTIALPAPAVEAGKTAAHASHTLAGSVIGTPAYMPPEQALGKIGRIDERSDVFGLGGILCQILTGKPPYVGRDVAELFDLARYGLLDDCFARLRASGAEQELIDLARSCLSKEPTERPRDARVVAERITGYLAGVAERLRAAEVQRAAESARAEQALHTAAAAQAQALAERRARRLQVGAAVFVLALTAAAGIAATWSAMYQSRLKREAQAAESKAILAGKAEAKERLLAQAAKKRADLALADMQTSRGLLAAQHDAAGEAALWFAAAAEQSHAAEDSQSKADSLLRAGNWLRQAVLPVGSLSLSSGPETLEFQPEGPHLLIQTDKSIHLWNWREGQLLEWAAALPNVNTAHFSPDGTLLAVGFPADKQSPDAEAEPEPAAEFVGLQLRQMPGGEIVRELHEIGQVIGLAFSPNGRYLALSGRGVRVFDVQQQKLLPAVWRHPKMVRAMVFNQAGDRLATASYDKQVRVFAVSEESAQSMPLFTVPHQPGLPSPPVFVDEDRGLITITGDGELTRFDMATGAAAEGGVLKLKPNSLSRVVASPDGQWVVSGGNYGPEIRRVADSAVAAAQLNHTNYVSDLAISPDSSLLATASMDQTSAIWSLAEGRSLGAPLWHTGSVNRCAWSGDSQFLATAQGDGLVRVWQRPAERVVAARFDDWGQRARLSFDGRLISPGMMHETPTSGPRMEIKRIVVLQALTSQPAGPEISLTGFLADSCICGDNRLVAAVMQGQGSRVGRFCAWDIATGQAQFEPIKLPGPATSISPRSASGEHVAVLCASGEVVVFDARDGNQILSRKLAEPMDQADPRARLEFTPDGQTLVALTQDDKVHVLDAETLEPRFPPVEPVVEGGPCRAMALSADNRLLATAVNGKNTAQVWSLADGRALSPPLAHPGDYFGLFCLCFSPDGSRLLTGSKDGQARYWDWQAGKLACPALPHSNEIWSVAITPDAQHALVALRGWPQELHLWELRTGKPLAPPLRLPSQNEGRLHSHTVAISRDGRLALSCDYGELRTVDLATLLTPPARNSDELSLLGELASGRRIELGNLSVLTKEEWQARWEQFHPNPARDASPTQETKNP